MGLEGAGHMSEVDLRTTTGQACGHQEWGGGVETGASRRSGVMERWEEAAVPERGRGLEPGGHTEAKVLERLVQVGQER